MCFKIPVSCVCGVQVRLHPRKSLQGVTVTEYAVLHFRSDSAHTGAVSLQWMTSLVCAAVVLYSSAPLTDDHMISRVSVETRFMVTSCGQQGTGGEVGKGNGKIGENNNLHCAKDHTDVLKAFSTFQAAIVFSSCQLACT